MTGLTVAIVGATGAVGRELLALLPASTLAVAGVRALASPRSAGRSVDYDGASLTVEPLTAGAFADVDLALFSAGAEVSREFADAAARAGALVVDNSSAFRGAADVPLVVPEINPGALSKPPRGIVANPNCSTIIFLMAAAPLWRAFGGCRALVSTYQAVSGAGARALAELDDQAAAVQRGAAPEALVFPAPIVQNCLPACGSFTETGDTTEELKFTNESRKILDDPRVLVDATCVRVPVRRCHAESITLALDRAATPAEARAVLSAAPGVQVVDAPLDAVVEARYPMPRAMAGRHAVAVGRVRAARALSPGLSLFVVGDQLLKGAALNAIQIAEAALGPALASRA